ncbi:MAG TPA: hypothetical protein IAC12_04440 [Candidatus Aphodovivens avistercoris]|nr:hypothetical protein [Candidatus Aphodovivens avistercoris]
MRLRRIEFKANRGSILWVLECLATLVSAGFLTAYLRFAPFMVGLFVFGILGIASLLKVRKGADSLSRRTKVLLAVFSALFDLSLVLGLHIVQSGSGYSGLMDANYISGYSAIDVVAFVFMFEAILLMATALLLAMKEKRSHNPIVVEYGSDIPLGRINAKYAVVIAAFLFLAWLPYLAVYYPGFIFGDTMMSVMQIERLSSFSNHHPLAFTLSLGICIKGANLFGFGMAAGCAIFCVVQMMVLAGTFSYLIAWIVGRLRFAGMKKRIISILLLLYFGASPYFASLSIALWKDPLFSAGLVIVTLYLADLIVFQEHLPELVSAKRIAVVVTSTLFVAFFRNNGVYILTLTAIALLIVAIRKTGKSDVFRRRAKQLLLTVTSVAISFCVITGPVFKLLGIASSPSVESLGIPLNQMARVAAYEGDMTDEDREYLDSVLPFELYPTTYRPCCTDLLKWDEHFDTGNFEEGFLCHWLSMLVRNPMLYFESWELQTFGYWTVNQPTDYSYDNIMAGDPQNGKDWVAGFGVDPSAGIQNEAVRTAFPHTGVSVPIGVLFWMMLYLAVVLIDARKASWLAVLVPSIGLIATLLIASPIWYWPRYAVAAQMLFPLYLALFYCAARLHSCQNDVAERGK